MRYVRGKSKARSLLILTLSAEAAVLAVVAVLAPAHFNGNRYGDVNSNCGNLAMYHFHQSDSRARNAGPIIEHLCRDSFQSRIMILAGIGILSIGLAILIATVIARHDRGRSA